MIGFLIQNMQYKIGIARVVLGGGWGYVGYKTGVNDIGAAIQQGKSSIKAINDVSKSAFKWTLAIGVVISVAFFLFELSGIGWDATSLGFTNALATLVASIVVSVILAMIAAIPIVGQLIVAIISLIDGIIAIFLF